MLEYQIKTFQPEFTELEINLRRELEQVLPEERRNYTTDEDLSSLKEYRATADTFFPENHYYAFAGDQFVGFIHAWPVNGNDTSLPVAISIPFVNPDHATAKEVLFNHLKSDLKSRGMTKIQLVTHEENSLERTIAKELGLEYEGEEHLSSINTPLSELSVQGTTDYSVDDFNLETDKEPVISLYEQIGYPRSRLEAQFTWMESLGDRLKSWKVIKSNSEIIAQSVAFTYENNETRSQVNSVTMSPTLKEEKEDIIHSIYASHLSALKNAGVETIDLTLFPQVKELAPYYEKIGFSFQSHHRYGMNL